MFVAIAKVSKIEQIFANFDKSETESLVMTLEQQSCMSKFSKEQPKKLYRFGTVQIKRERMPKLKLHKKWIAKKIQKKSKFSKTDLKLL